MIISHRHKFIFVKSLKTAGTSLETFLASYCGDDDTVTPINVDDEMIRRGLGIYPKNYIKCDGLDITDEKFLDISSAEELKSFRDQIKYDFSKVRSKNSRLIWTNHTRAKKIKKNIDTEVWNSYYKFCFDRNPWQRTLSAFYFLRKKVEFATDIQVYNFAKKKSENNPQFCNSSFYTDSNGEVILDDVFDFDSLDASVKQICDKLGFDFEKFKGMPKFKSTTRHDHRPYNEFLSQKTIDLIADINKRSIKIMNYKALPSIV